eukprot:3486554-Rhodomonas_salina.1
MNSVCIARACSRASTRPSLTLRIAWTVMSSSPLRTLVRARSSSFGNRKDASNLSVFFFLCTIPHGISPASLAECQLELLSPALPADPIHEASSLACAPVFDCGNGICLRLLCRSASFSLAVYPDVTSASFLRLAWSTKQTSKMQTWQATNQLILSLPISARSAVEQS